MHVVQPPKKRRDLRLEISAPPNRVPLALLQAHGRGGYHKDRRRPAKVNGRAEQRRDFA